ncbi:hypothetical protein, unlikely [Trypanosoma brucei gambiense DAL972]|uniref:Uncharacterized protein n=1 Tax=Trypanosoma brucei gambiense (strain MHOM/CI/86/DAL972) TaxID=679716 RepID=C9ZPK5_TRYB9|nr:hypothetical protein, unlikely [Trypanosoma brucei gambiense DAL972]CBH11333.1 hypothetical protein, unlikely [Trypanosoma brucei gambiense DAL972]|eukprot:XP_011773620.1 hypothetical protein, unlikely [Trypanosoma brucei gambiense DAL972]
MKRGKFIHDVNYFFVPLVAPSFVFNGGGGGFICFSVVHLIPISLPFILLFLLFYKLLPAIGFSPLYRLFRRHVRHRGCDQEICGSPRFPVSRIIAFFFLKHIPLTIYNPFFILFPLFLFTRCVFSRLRK